MRAKDWTAEFAGICHRDMQPLRAGLCGRKRIAILYE